jgi:hypothetical protein
MIPRMALLRFTSYSLLKLVSCDSNYFFLATIGTSLANITYHVQHLKLMGKEDDDSNELQTTARW